AKRSHSPADGARGRTYFRRVAKRDNFLLATVGHIDTEYFVDFFIADVEKSRGIPNRPFRKSKPGGDGRELCVVIHKRPKFRRFSKQFERPFGCDGSLSSQWR